MTLRGVSYTEFQNIERVCYATAVKEKAITHCWVVSEEDDGSYTVETLDGKERLGSLTYHAALRVGDPGILFIEDGVTKFVRKPPD